jgi:hypothetical protein
MNQQILYSAALLWIVTSGCSGSSGATSESGQGGGATPVVGTTGGLTNSGGMRTGGNNTGPTQSGGQTGSGGTVGVPGSGGIHTGGTASTSSTSGGQVAIGGNTVASTGGNRATGGNASGSASGGRANGGSASGGVATGGRIGVGGSNTGAAGATRATGGTATGGANSSMGGAAGGSSRVVLPEANASFDYQIGGAYTPPAGVRVVSRDRNSAPATGLYNICYVNGFQIQPDEESFWTSQHPSLILKDASGNPVVDADWGEMLIDTSTAAKRTELATIVGGWIAQCKTDGFNAVEIDNLDSYSRSNGLLTQANNIAFMAQLASIAHANGLAIAQKNSSELLGSVSAMGTDFAVVEECNRYGECGSFKAVYGNLVFIIEYRSQDFQTGCSTYPELSIVLRDLNVSTPGSSGYVYQGC